jgi:pyrimidine-nucleoside phosphorylase
MINMVSIIEKKSEGLSLTNEEIRFFVLGYTQGTIPDYQVSSLLMAIKLKGMNEQETSQLTQAMVDSGQTVDLSSIHGVKVDKHSTGGVGDKTSLVIGPIVATCGLKLAKMSGRGLGHTGGTIDKLESMPGLTTSLSSEQFFKQVNTIGMAIIGQTGELVPADKKLYALRDVTGTVQSIPLIAASIMSKKIASGAQTILLDVKFGRGAFMQTVEDARILAKTMVDIGNRLGRHTMAMLSDMDQPLGYAIGNRLEVKEAMDTLKGQGPKDFETLCIQACALMLVQGGVTKNLLDAEAKVKSTIEDGSAYRKFVDFISAQGGHVQDFDDPMFLKTKYEQSIPSLTTGYVAKMNALTLGKVALLLGAGRLTKEDSIDPKAGIILHKKTEHNVQKGEPLLTLYSNQPIDPSIIDMVYDAFTISLTPLAPSPIVLETIR